VLLGALLGSLFSTRQNKKVTEKVLVRKPHPPSRRPFRWTVMMTGHTAHEAFIIQNAAIREQRASVVLHRYIPSSSIPRMRAASAPTCMCSHRLGSSLPLAPLQPTSAANSSNTAGLHPFSCKGQSDVSTRWKIHGYGKRWQSQGAHNLA